MTEQNQSKIETLEPQPEFIKNELGETCFISGNGKSRSSPYQPVAMTSLDHALTDAYHTIMYAPESQRRVFFEFSGLIVGVDRNMEVIAVPKKGEPERLDFQRLLTQTAQNIRESNTTMLGENELEKFRLQMMEQVKINNGEVSFAHRFINKLYKKLRG